jgi:hypothetical protein
VALIESPSGGWRLLALENQGRSSCHQGAHPIWRCRVEDTDSVTSRTLAVAFSRSGR